MTLSLNVLRHLGIGLYSNIGAVLSELKANAWDADASTVEIFVNTEDGVVYVKDDGSGMQRTHSEDGLPASEGIGDRYGTRIKLTVLHVLFLMKTRSSCLAFPADGLKVC